MMAASMQLLSKVHASWAQVTAAAAAAAEADATRPVVYSVLPLVMNPGFQAMQLRAFISCRDYRMF